MNNFIDYKIKSFLLRKRCSVCFKSYHYKNCTIIQQFGLADKKKFVFARPSFSIKDSYRFYSMEINMIRRNVLTPHKTRAYAPIYYIEIDCDNCGNYKEFEIDINNVEALT